MVSVACIWFSSRFLINQGHAVLRMSQSEMYLHDTSPSTLRGRGASNRKARRNSVAGSSPRSGKGNSSRVGFRCRLSTLLRCPYSPVWNRMRPNLCTRKNNNNKNQTLTAIPVKVFGHLKIVHALVEMVSAALVAPVALPRIRCKGLMK